jgi:hypothetical protein
MPTDNTKLVAVKYHSCGESGFYVVDFKMDGELAQALLLHEPGSAFLLGPKGSRVTFLRCPSLEAQLRYWIYENQKQTDRKAKIK